MLRRHCAFWRREWDAWKGNDQIKRHYEVANREVRYARGAMKNFQKLDRVTLYRSEIIRRVQLVIGKLRERTTVNCTVGKVKSVKKADRQLAVTVGYMWRERVDKVMYQRGYNDPEWFILDAIRYRVNSKRLALYQCLAFNMRTGEKKDIYIAETLGRTSFVVAHSAQNAIKRGEDAIKEMFVSEISIGGEEKNDC